MPLFSPNGLLLTTVSATKLQLLPLTTRHGVLLTIHQGLHMVFSKLKTLAIATALFSVIGFANATPVPLGALTDTKTSSDNNIFGVFDDVLSFTVNAPMNVEVGISGWDL